MRDIKKIIIHCSDSEFGDAALIDKWHREERHWDKIGYHFVILNGVRVAHSPFKDSENGLLETGRDEIEVGAHCEGHNSDSLGVCLIGIKTFTPGQLATLGILIRSIMDKYGLCPKDVYGHYEFNPAKTCPNMDMDAVRAALLKPEEHPITEEFK